MQLLTPQFVASLCRPFVDVVAPSVCVVCTAALASDQLGRSEFMCGRCLDSLDTAPSPDEILNDLLTHFPNDSLSISAAFSRYAARADSLDGILEAVHCLKYRGFSRLGVELGRELGSLMEFRGCATYDAVLPVPIHRARRRERGYNQAECIANGIVEVLHIPINTDFLERVRYTSTQTRLSKDDRIRNVENAFQNQVNTDAILNSTLLVVDDVLTTGSTLNSIATHLLECGARRVDVATIVKAL